MKFIIFVLAAIALVYTAIAAPAVSYSKDRCGPGYGSCDEGECCSEYGWCGKSNDHCGVGCQPKYGICKSEDRCGPGYGSCSEGKCCSKYGWCGTSADYCDECQPGYGFCTKLISPSSREFVPGVGKIEYAGFRFSEGGVKKNYGKIPDGDSWVNLVNKMKRNFNSDAKPTVIVIVSYNSNDVINTFGFPAPKGRKETKYIKYSSTDKYESILTTFDKKGVNVWLQVEPGDNDLNELADIVFQQYGHHSCVRGYGIDLEWWYRRSDRKGSKLSDSYAKEVVQHVRSLKPSADLTVFAKHWKKEFMPPTYRDHMVFVNDSNGFSSMDRVKKEFGEWAQKFSSNTVFYQIGYKGDEKYWGSNPVKFAKDIINEVTKYNKHVGILWVDFTMKQALEKM